MSEVIRFHQATLFAGSVGTVDKQNCVVHGVSLITSGITATGHDLFVDDTSVNTFHEMGTKMGKLPVNLDHGSGIVSMNGFCTNFRKDGGKWRGDWYLLKTHEETPVMLERCERQPETFGFSLAFSGDKAGVLRLGKKCAHPEALLSADCVVRPAANKSLFSARDNTPAQRFDAIRQAIVQLSVDRLRNNNSTNMPNPNDLQNQNGEPTIAELMEQVELLTQHVTKQNEVIGQLQQGQQQEEGEQGYQLTVEDLKLLNDASDEELIANGYTREWVQGQVDAYNQSLMDDHRQQEESQPQYEGDPEGDGALAAAAAGQGDGAAFSAMAKRIIALEAHIKNKEASEIQFTEQQATDEVRGKIAFIVNQNKQLKEFAAEKAAEVDALRMAGSTGTRPVHAGIQFSERSQGGDVIEFETVVQTKFQELMQKKGAKEISAKSQAIDFGVKRHGDAYKLYRKRGSPQIDFSVPQ